GDIEPSAELRLGQACASMFECPIKVGERGPPKGGTPNPKLPGGITYPEAWGSEALPTPSAAICSADTVNTAGFPIASSSSTRGSAAATTPSCRAAATTVRRFARLEAPFAMALTKAA